MITKNDLWNLVFLIASRLQQRRMEANSVLRRIRRKTKKAIKNGYWPKTDSVPTPELMLGVIRNTFPTSVRGQFVSEFAKEVSSLGNQTVTPFDELVIQGGAVHEFGRGFRDRPWQLVHQTGTISHYENSEHSMKVIKTSKVVDRLRPTWRVDLPTKIREKWMSVIDAHNIQQNAEKWRPVRKE